MAQPLVIAAPSKGRLKEQVEAWLADCGLDLALQGGARGYSASLKGVAEVKVRLASAGEIAEALTAGDVHLGITGEDLLRETPAALEARVLLLKPLGFGRADLVVAAPRSWLDVETMADLEEVAHEHLARSGRRLRVATKYLAQTRAFFTRHGVSDYRIVESGGATEGAPAAGAAEVVVDITTTGATLAANGLKPLADGLILASQAQLAASLAADWGSGALAAAERILRIVEARSAARASAILSWPAAGTPAESKAVARLTKEGAIPRPGGLLVSAAGSAEAALALTAAGLGPVAVSRPEFVYEVACPAFEALRNRVL